MYVCMYECMYVCMYVCTACMSVSCMLCVINDGIRDTERDRETERQMMSRRLESGDAEAGGAELDRLSRRHEEPLPPHCIHEPRFIQLLCYLRPRVRHRQLHQNPNQISVHSYFTAHHHMSHGGCQIHM